MNHELDMSEDSALKKGHEIDRHMLEILICPLTQSTLVWDRNLQELVSPMAGLAYPVRNGVPIMLESEARILSETERARHKAKHR